MKWHALSLLAVALSGLAPAGTATIDEATPRAPVAARLQVAAARKQHKTPQTAPMAVAPPAAKPWNGPDPTKGPGIERLRQLQRQGRCVVDEGYGRYTFCDSY